MSSKRKGEIAIAGALITGGVALFIAGLGGFFSLNNKISEAQTETAVLQSNYKNLEKKIDLLDQKVERLLEKLDPTYKSPKQTTTEK